MKDTTQGAEQHEPDEEGDDFLPSGPIIPTFSPVDNSNRKTRMMTERQYLEYVPETEIEFPIGNPLKDCPGLLGQLADHISRASVMRSPCSGLAAALPVLGAVMGRAYQTETRLRTNVYAVVLADSGDGKTSTVSPSKEMLISAGLNHIIGPDRYASGNGVLKALADNPVRVSFLDEFGHMLQQIRNPGSGAHMRQILTEFTALYSAANTLYAGIGYAGKPPAPIDCPHLCLFGMATPGQLWKAFGSGSLEDGTVARYLIMPAGTTWDNLPDNSQARTVELGLRAIAAETLSVTDSKSGILTPMTVRMDENARKEYRNLVKTMRTLASFATATEKRGAPAVLRRVAENAAKIALISAVGRDPRNPKINEFDFAIGHAIARWSAIETIRNIAIHIADNHHEADLNRIEDAIRKAGKRGIRRTELGRRSRAIKRRDLNEILEQLIESNDVVRVEGSPTGKGRPEQRFFHRIHAPETGPNTSEQRH